MKILFISNLCSEKKINYIINNAKNKPLQSIQKFNRLICKGFKENNQDVEIISSLPITRKILNKIYFKKEKEIEEGLSYLYLGFFNIKLIKQICIFCGIMNEINQQYKENKEIVCICDILNKSTMIATRIICRLKKIKCITIVTDMPEDINSNKFFRRIYKSFDGYIFLTEQMNGVINNNKPHVIIEGISEKKRYSINNNNNSVFKIMYCGGLYEKYGIKDLIDAVLKIDEFECELNLYGNGDVVDYINSIKNNKIKYYGVVLNEDIVNVLPTMDLLVNPRKNEGEYVKYSFPSKTIEYMISGVPVLMYKLDGIPNEYDSYLYYINGNTVDDIANEIRRIYSYGKEVNNKFGEKAQDFIFKNKNYKIQSNKIISDLIY